MTKIVDQSKFKAFAEGIINVTQKLKIVLEDRKILREKEKMQVTCKMFSKGLLLKVVKVGIVQ